MTYRVFIVDDDEIVRLGLRTLLAAEADFELVGEAADGRTAVRQVHNLLPHVVLIDVRLGGEDGVAVCRELRSIDPSPACLMFTSYADDTARFNAAMAGAVGYVLKQVHGDELVQSLRKAAQGEMSLDPSLLKTALERTGEIDDSEAGDLTAALTPQERRILGHIAEGKTNRQIAESMFLAEKTVKNYVSNLLSKLSMNRRTEAAAYAARLAEQRRRNY